MKEAQDAGLSQSHKGNKLPLIRGDADVERGKNNIGSSKRVDEQGPMEIMKSPSDSTLYTPALKKGVEKDMVIDKISNSVESIRAESEGHRSGSGGSRRVKRDRSSEDITLVEGEGLDFAREKAQNAVLEAKRFQAKVQSPGKETSFVQPYRSDDEFFHLTCHIDDGMVKKIEAGNYVDLEKLLPKEKSHKLSDETRLEWVHREGGTFLVPAGGKENRITGIRKWEQAFRAYATIYCGAHPNRAKEIWQYISVINTAASSYIWEYVANYNFTFWHLMEFNPERSWATTYNQMWNLCMRDPIPRNGGHGGHGYVQKFQHTCQASGSGQGTGGGGGGQQKCKKSDYCWNYNKGVKCKYGSKCRFIE